MKHEAHNIKHGARSGGFTLLETLVALAVFSMAILGPLTLASYSIHAASFARNQVTAFYLALEGLEFVRNLRDTNGLHNELNWLRYLNPCVHASGSIVCTIDATDGDISNCGGSCPRIRYDSSTGEYGYGSGSETPFVREIRITSPYNGRAYEALVQVTMKWPERFGQKTLVIEEHIFDWK